MRWLFLFVLVLNLAYFGWQYSRSTEDVSVDKNRSNIPSIVLLSELEQFRSEQKESKQAEIQGESAEVKEIVESPQVTSGSSGGQSPVVVAAQNEPRAEGCYTLGPFRELDELRDFTRLIKDYVENASFRSRDEVEQSLFRVFLGPAETDEQAKALSERLKVKKITDHYVVAKGPREKSISLGHFKVKDSAYGHADSIKKKGFDAKVEPVFKNYTLYWLDYKLAAGKVIPEGYFKTKLDSKVTRLDRACS